MRIGLEIGILLDRRAAPWGGVFRDGGCEFFTQSGRFWRCGKVLKFVFVFDDIVEFFGSIVPFQVGVGFRADREISETP